VLLLFFSLSEYTNNNIAMLEPSDVSLDIERAEIQASCQLHSPSNTDSPVEPDHPSSGSSDTHTNNDDDLSRQCTHRDIIPGPRDEDSNRIQLERQRTHLSIYSNTVGRTVDDYAAKDELPPFGGGKEYPPQLPHREQYVVEFEGSDDPMHGQNWPLKKKYVCCSTCTDMLIYQFVEGVLISITGWLQLQSWDTPL
jgi:DHA1 family multidrug resistance protein-like MFS transporter